MRLLAFVLLLFCVGALWFFVRNDAAEYAAFKRLTDTADRQRRYRVWALKSFAVFFAGGLICLALLHRVDAVIMLPLEFRPVAGHLQSAVGRWQLPSAGFAIGFGGATIIGLLLGVVLRSRSGKSKPVTVGDIQALIPRNWPEIAHGVLLSVNAGLNEELFFRLLLPLLFAIVLGNALLAFVLAALIFGFVHLYQGWLGIVATSVLGLALTALYLWSGVLWAAMAAHALLDMLSLVIRPALSRLLVRQAVSAS